jgi:hypothetical protein
MTGKPKREGRLKVPFGFDEAISRALRVKPPEEGWKNYERAKARANRREPRPLPADEADKEPDEER